MIYHCIQCSSNESNRKSNQFCVSTQNLSHISHTNADALYVLQDACSQGLFICNLFPWKNNKKWRTQFPFLPSQNIAATSETRTLQKHRIIIRGLVFHPSGSSLFFKDVDGFSALIPRKIATKKVLAEPGACRWRYGTRCFKTQGTSAFEDQNIQRFPRFLCSNGPWMVGKMP